MAIRRATGADVEGIVGVARAAYRETYPAVLGEGVVEELLSEWYTPGSVRDSLASPDGRTFVATDTGDGPGGNGEVIGFASGGPWTGDDREEGDAILGALYVHPGRWREGYGGRLYDRVRTDCRERGLERLWVHVFADNDVGRSFYEDRADHVRYRVDELAGNEYDVAVYVDRF